MPTPRSRAALAGFLPFAVVSTLHVIALAIGDELVSNPTKLMLMPLLAVGALWSARGRGIPLGFLLAAIGLSWLGDGAGTFFPDLPSLPMMLLWFGLAHLVYIWLFQRHRAVRRMPLWTFAYAAWWIAMLAVLWPHLGTLTWAVAGYGLVLGGTAASAARCTPVIAAGGAFFLASDTLLAFRLFLPDAMPDWTSPLVMITYCLGQGLIAAGVVTSRRRRG
ncbi:lysoplasmalogenase [Microbacterium protaetiae]|uniref:Lysoplasmalogenase n=1 Tax=Microbacterium protaetiae TaxID=2509458 RepID=A0A4V0YCW1_9MICO|nr:lysoplasmalogenase [Microbacterium protaetiae]QAY58591.1 lysoplasmalogenase [Microbacterium protaetiae]